MAKGIWLAIDGVQLSHKGVEVTVEGDCETPPCWRRLEKDLLETKTSAALFKLVVDAKGASDRSVEVHLAHDEGEGEGGKLMGTKIRIKGS